VKTRSDSMEGGRDLSFCFYLFKKIIKVPPRLFGTIAPGEVYKSKSFLSRGPRKKELSLYYLDGEGGGPRYKRRKTLEQRLNFSNSPGPEAQKTRKSGV